MARTVTARSPIPPDVAKKHPGKWVAVRDASRIVGVGSSLEEVRSKRGVKGTDMVFAVPRRDSAILL